MDLWICGLFKTLSIYIYIRRPPKGGHPAVRAWLQCYYNRSQVLSSLRACSDPACSLCNGLQACRSRYSGPGSPGLRSQVTRSPGSQVCKLRARVVHQKSPAKPGFTELPQLLGPFFESCHHRNCRNFYASKAVIIETVVLRFEGCQHRN